MQVEISLIVSVAAGLVGISGFILTLRKKTGTDEKWKGMIEAQVKSLYKKNEDQDLETRHFKDAVSKDIKMIRSEINEVRQEIKTDIQILKEDLTKVIEILTSSK